MDADQGNSNPYEPSTVAPEASDAGVTKKKFGKVVLVIALVSLATSFVAIGLKMAGIGPYQLFNWLSRLINDPAREL